MHHVQAIAISTWQLEVSRPVVQADICCASTSSTPSLLHLNSNKQLSRDMKQPSESVITNNTRIKDEQIIFLYSLNHVSVLN